ncbi:cell division/GTP binding protein [Basidiobolus meristosporus CBS 931.73]|uniref:Cell division/GTP binding protein n=1 Tax=Basidiobolus meristosporus CBS 931.73 TaxID=1314790 RepID=A0A1Y1YPH6_9FUNG|nr:cell division/GTP binding protein [Basidiobolus meristosporus CBS 931.73]ORX99911.1 cell division/GTP binding protein [Basidiobolus meristosporus CBS 931.73]|eukprot:ORX63385.1 cell division/GTP binding protein [Basidiobolus meristosporus CBS 931.73]
MSHRYGGRWKNAKKGLQFTIMVVGASGLGRTTFVNTLCEKKIFPNRTEFDPETAHVPKPIEIRPVNTELEEDSMRIALTVVDTPGFGDGIDNENSFREILNYVEQRYDIILSEESRIRRNPKFQDNRVHALIYFITPTGHSLREMDIELMKRLGPRVNIIPVIGKADTLTPSELATFKKRVMADIEYYRIPIYHFPNDHDDDEEMIAENNELRALLPFAVIGSEEEFIVDGVKVRGRRYPWGHVDVDNPEHCDFDRLRFMLLNSHMTDLRELTHNVLYENYRTEKLSRMSPDMLE